MKTSDFVSVEPRDHGFDVVVWTVDGDPIVFIPNLSEQVAARKVSVLRRVLATWQ